ncbi:hypothetical protein RHMOL_Rhmol09G0137500 [Rhododendron molle]|uniref:Uncharacterized protein n=1 Tax=Rhododendron molle TaxID=49168 RepID=A0ACC0MCU4_RHOML|nr:hypothetical protein RHMOL_Rhmol09G0137500 [Rhododendron molle]
MHCSTSFSFSKPQILASLSGNNSPTPPRPPPNANPRPPQHALTAAAAEQEQIKKLQKRKRKQPSVAEIERAIGAGMFKDRDTSNRNAEKNKTLFDRFLSITIGETEGSVEKKLRESGEWIIDRTEKAPKSTDQRVAKLALKPHYMYGFEVTYQMNFAFSIRVAGLSTFMLSIYLYLMDRGCNQQNLLFACSQSELVSQNFLLTEQTALLVLVLSKLIFLDSVWNNGGIV